MERNYASWAEAFTIFAKYDNAEFASVAAEHDILYAGPDPRQVSLADRRRLRQLGWYLDKQYECFHKFV